ncbi:hypothetical protein [Spirosoma foliorum]|uniref:DUF748 domain-containing protein n=1 Tax=Spirosoma foliorum TaxID=2710596 RepID=A0A7G5GX68_9BACT|nr:hypothetical protein [Spirosoma foliorum]QMW03460.1 hypothetical protein H3H32_00365 [Spirosoma foliorum]
MKLSSKSWGKLLFLVAAVLSLAAGGLYYILINNLKDIITYAIDKETKGGYTFQTKNLSLSILNKTVSIDGLLFARKDTTNVPAYYTVKIPQSYLSIESWRELLIHKKLLVDSFSVSKPEIVIHDYKVHSKSHNQTRFHTSSILENLQKTLDHLHAKSFNVQSGSFALIKRNSAGPFVIKDINLVVHNFSKIDNDNRRILGSDRIEVSLGPQQWVLSDGKNTLSFRGLRFASATQLFEIDSVHFRKPATAQKGEMSLRAEKFFFNSTHLPAVYQKGELWLDTLICVRPILTLPIESRKEQITDTSGTIHANIKTLFKTVTIRYTQVQDGQILLANKRNPTSQSGTRKANLTIYNLALNQQNDHSLSTDSVNLSLRNIAFFSPDSLFKISVESFQVLKKDLIFRNVLYGTTSRKVTGKGLTFKAPLLHLHNIDFEDLMQKRLVASAAELVQPSIVVLATPKASLRPKPYVASTTPPKKVDLFKTLHGLGELLRVNHFRIINANAQYKLGGDAPMEVSMKNMNATVLLNDFLVSDSLIDMKHAIPNLTVANAHLTTKKLNVSLTNYTLYGQQRYNGVDKIQMDLANGSVLTANKVYWEAFAWDALQQSKDVQIELLRVHDLAIDMKSPVKKRSTSTKNHAPDQIKEHLPRIHIAQLMADHLTLKAALSKQIRAGFQGSSIRIDSLTTDTGYFGWNQISGKLNDLYLNQPGGKQVSIASVDLNSQQITTLTNLRYTDNSPGKTLQVALPKIRVIAPFNSTDFSTIRLQSLQLDQPEISLLTTGQPKTEGSGPANGFAIPFTFTLHELSINGANVTYINPQNGDSVRVRTVVDVEGKGLYGAKQEALTFASLRVSPSNIALTSPRLKTVIPAATVQLTNGKVSATQAGKPILIGDLQATLTANDLHPVLKAKRSNFPSLLSLGHLTATVNFPSFVWTAGKKIAWATWMNHTNLAVNDVLLKRPGTAFQAGTLTWTPQNARLQVNHFQITPTMPQEEFMTPPHFQADYITVKGEEAQFNGLSMAQWRRDSTISIHHVVAKNVTADISRDKRLPDPDFIPEKLMPTRLIRRVNIPFHIDSISVVNSNVIYHETSKLTNRVGNVPLMNINGVLKNITNRPRKTTDSLALTASTKLLGLNIDRLQYRESYSDSLAGFHMQLNTSGVRLPEMSSITNPIIAANLDGGYVQPIIARVVGNQYASVGNMRFHYKDLKISLLSPADTTKKTFLIRVKNFVIGKVLRKKNETDSSIFYDRDPQTFIFGYWIKTMTSGILTSIGVKNNKKYRANYLKLSQQHPLPAYE